MIDADAKGLMNLLSSHTRVCRPLTPEWRWERGTKALRLFAVLVCLGFPGGSLLYAQGFPPTEAAQRMTLADGFQVKLVAGGPMIRQPVAIEFDDRGRLWVIQYLQYPNPAGLKRSKVDRYSRTVYDRVPEPPPRGPKEMTGSLSCTTSTATDEPAKPRTLLAI